MLRVAAYTAGRATPSARFRVRQYVPALRELGVEMREWWSPLGSYPPRTRWLRPLWGAAAAAERALAAAHSFRAELTLLQREMLSTLITAEPLTRRPRVLDVDDAIFLHRDGRFAARLARLCDLVICGNAFLAGEFHRWNPQVTVLATAVDTDRFQPGAALDDRQPLLGWSGTSSGFPYLESLQPALAVVLARHPRARLRVIADLRPRLAALDPERVEFLRWSPQVEVGALQELAVGLMPLDDTPWARGKCSFKMLTYMACGIPVVASPVGMNAEVLARGGGAGAQTRDGWVEALDHYLRHATEARRTGRQGREIVLQHYSLRVIAPRLAQLLATCAEQSAANGRMAAAGRSL
ncbi:MAG: glycosyltransferase family 4 protein [Acidobacteria bacterium]|nr:glycosyltransferase family 4 protein [Acidobacteriota bacterium]